MPEFSLIYQPLQIPPVNGLAVSRRQAAQIIGADEPFRIRDLFRTTDQESLPVLHRTYELRRLEEGIVASGVEPRVPATQFDDVKLPQFEIVPVDVCDLELAARRGAQPGSDVEHCVVIKIQCQATSGIDPSTT
jgi:hypothetical protein